MRGVPWAATEQSQGRCWHFADKCVQFNFDNPACAGKKMRQPAALGKVGEICSSLRCPLCPSQDHMLLLILFFAVTAIALVLFLAVVQRNVACLLNTLSDVTVNTFM